MSTTTEHQCPACGAELIDVPLRCTRCLWRLITLEGWQKLKPFGQGYYLYSQSCWPTSPLANETNPYAEGTPEWESFRQGERRATLDAQDGEE